MHISYLQTTIQYVAKATNVITIPVAADPTVAPTLNKLLFDAKSIQKNMINENIKSFTSRIFKQFDYANNQLI